MHESFLILSPYVIAVAVVLPVALYEIGEFLLQHRHELRHDGGAQAERLAVAHTCSATLEISMPLLVDQLNDRVGHAYSGMPARLYVIDSSGKVTYKSARGPFGFRPQEMEQALALTLVASTKPQKEVAAEATKK